MRGTPRILAGNDEVRKWWRSRVSAYGSHYFAKAASDLPPQRADELLGPNGRVFSTVFERGFRCYCFEQQSDRDRFVRKYHKVFDARPVGENPCP